MRGLAQGFSGSPLLLPQRGNTASFFRAAQAYHSCLSGGMVPVSAEFKHIISSKDAVIKIRHTRSVQLNNLF